MRTAVASELPAVSGPEVATVSVMGRVDLSGRGSDFENAEIRMRSGPAKKFGAPVTGSGRRLTTVLVRADSTAVRSLGYTWG